MSSRSHSKNHRNQNNMTGHLRLGTCIATIVIVFMVGGGGGICHTAEAFQHSHQTNRWKIPSNGGVISNPRLSGGSHFHTTTTSSSFRRSDPSSHDYAGTSSSLWTGQDLDNSVSNHDNNWLKRKALACKSLATRTQRWIQTVKRWKDKRGKSLIAAAALSLSILFATQQQQYPGDTFSNTPTSSTNTEVVVRSKSLQTSSSHHGPSDDAYNQYPSQFVRGGSSSSGGVAIPKPQWRKAEEQMEHAVVVAAETTSNTFVDALVSLQKYMKGPKSDTLLLLLATALITPICRRLGTSPILGFLASGMLLGPNGWGLISGIHTTETLAELGIVFFLFEMGIELSIERLLSMKRDVFGLGLSQFVVTAVAIACAGGLAGLPANAMVVLGGGIALSSSAFVLQLLKDKKQLATRFGKACFGVLLFQDLAVVPLLVVTPILAGGGGGLAQALGSAILKAGIALGSIAVAGRYILNPLFKIVAQARSQEAFLGLILLTVLSMSFMTEGLGLSNTLGAFLAGVLLSETKYRYQVEADIAPFRGVLLGLFFVTVGFEIDVGLIASNIPQVSAVVLGILVIKAAIVTALSLAFGLSMSVSQQAGLILSQGGEFAFVAFGLARSLGILDKPTTKLLLTCVSLTMALTPALASVGSKIAKSLEEKNDFTYYLGQDRDANEISESDDFAVVIGYGAVGKVVCDLLDRKLIKYVGIDIDPNKAIQARNAGLPIFYGDIGRQEVAEAFNVGKANAVIVCISDQQLANRAVIALRRWFPDLKIFCRAKNKDHAFRLQSTLDVAAMVPILPEDNLLLTLPFGGAVLKALGAPAEEVNAILEAKRKEVMSEKSLGQTEEDLALIQLGIEPKEYRKVDEAGDTKSKAPSMAMLGVTKEKSPMVAQVIGEIFPTVKSVDVVIDVNGEETTSLAPVSTSSTDDVASSGGD